jgi:hypothetical protein
MCSATGYPVAKWPAYTRREIDYPAIVPSLAVTRMQFNQLKRRESTVRAADDAGRAMKSPRERGIRAVRGASDDTDHYRSTSDRSPEV